MELERLLQTLQEKGYRLTRQRRLVMAVLQESQEHLDAEALHSKARERDPRISLATVYRTLAVLKEVGLVKEHRLGEEHAHFEAAPQEPHYHFTCLGCGKVIEFTAPEVAQVVRRVGKQKNLQISDVHLFLSGYCDQCQKGDEDDR